MRNVRPIAEDELQRVLTFWQGDHGFGLSCPEMQVMIISRNWRCFNSSGVSVVPIIRW